MSSLARLLEQRSIGHVTLRMGCAGPQVLREHGSAKVRVPRGGHEAILINTSGGLAGGDDVGFDISCEARATLTVTNQAAERVYRTLGPSASIKTSLKLGAHSSLNWLPQETILFDGSALERHYDIDLAYSARFLALEAIVFGRHEMGEHVKNIKLRDRWRIKREGHLIHADDFLIEQAVPESRATLGASGAMAMLICIADNAETKLDAIRAALGGDGGATAWNGKLVARLLAKDGHHLRKRLIPMLSAALGDQALPKVWTF
jgi:urease accessory protein